MVSMETKQMKLKMIYLSIQSSFLMSLMNEIQVTSGSVKVNGRIAYASQESWSFNSSILQNIMFGKPYDIRKWREVISVCAMKRDLKLFPFGEKTLVGERGVSLSGGQKARITLARFEPVLLYLVSFILSLVTALFTMTPTYTYWTIL